MEVREPKGIGRCRMAPLDDASGDTLGTFVTENVQPGATVITDGWAAYRAISGKGYQHRPINQKAARAAGDDPDSLLPGVHRVASLCKRWLLGTHQGSVDAAHLPAYLNEFVSGSNRRRSASRGMVFYRVLQLAAGHEPVRYVDLLASKKPRRAKRAEGGTGHPPGLQRLGGPPVADRRNPAAVSSPVKWIPQIGVIPVCPFGSRVAKVSSQCSASARRHPARTCTTPAG